MMKLAKACLIAAVIGCATFSALAKTTAAEKSKADAKVASIEQRMKAMRLPEVSFKPPATIVDAVEFFRVASKDFDLPEIPEEKRGFNFVLNCGALLLNDDGNGPEPPAIPALKAKDISFYDALKLVCDSVDYMFVVRDSIVIIE